MKSLDYWNNVKARLKSLNMTQVELAREAGTPYEVVRQWISRCTLPDLPTSVAISKVLGLSTEVLLGKQVDNPRQTHVFGGRLRQLMEKKGQSAEELSVLLGVPLSRLEEYLGLTDCPIDTQYLINLANHFAVPIDYLCARVHGASSKAQVVASRLHYLRSETLDYFDVVSKAELEARNPAIIALERANR
jgi:transcriptional regulator with XRE-family HTH domain